MGEETREETKLQVWTRRDRRWTAQLVRDAGGLLTIGFEVGQAPKVRIGELVEWAESVVTIPRRMGSVATTYSTSTLDHIVVSPRARPTAAPAAPRTRGAGFGMR